MSPSRIVICGTQVPFARGGAEGLVVALRSQLIERGYEVELVTLPFAWAPRVQIFRSAMAWRLLDLTKVEERPVDLVICTRFPSYVVRHPNKVVWLIHQFRQVYELMDTPFSDFGESAEDQAAIDLVRRIDRRTLGEARRLFTISDNTAKRLRRYLDLDARTLYPPTPLRPLLQPRAGGDYVLAVGRLDPLKRFHLLVEALARTSTPLRAQIVGEGPELPELQALVARLGLTDRVEFVGRLEDDRLAERYGGALGVFYAPYDEDYGYVTLEAFHCGKPVLTAADSGGVLEFVEHDRTGWVAERADAAALAPLLDRLWSDRATAEKLGGRGRESVEDIDWDGAIEALTETL